MSRLCRLHTKTHGQDGQWAYEEIKSLRYHLSYMTALVIGYVNQDESVPDDLMLFAKSFIESAPDENRTVEQIIRGAMELVR